MRHPVPATTRLSRASLAQRSPALAGTSCGWFCCHPLGQTRGLRRPPPRQSWAQPQGSARLSLWCGEPSNPFPSIVHYSKSPTQTGVPCQERVRKSNRRKWQPTAVFLHGIFMDRGAWWTTVYGVTNSRRHACTPNYRSAIILRCTRFIIHFAQRIHKKQT